jgi:hypothetical protein
MENALLQFLKVLFWNNKQEKYDTSYIEKIVKPEQLDRIKYFFSKIVTDELNYQFINEWVIFITDLPATSSSSSSSSSSPSSSSSSPISVSGSFMPIMLSIASISNSEPIGVPVVSGSIGASGSIGSPISSSSSSSSSSASSSSSSTNSSLIQPVIEYKDMQEKNQRPNVGDIMFVKDDREFKIVNVEGNASPFKVKIDNTNRPHLYYPEMYIHTDNYYKYVDTSTSKTYLLPHFKKSDNFEVDNLTNNFLSLFGLSSKSTLRITDVKFTNEKQIQVTLSSNESYTFNYLNDLLYLPDIKNGETTWYKLNDITFTSINAVNFPNSKLPRNYKQKYLKYKQKYLKLKSNI